MLEVDTIRLVEMKEKIRKVYLRWMSKLLETAAGISSDYVSRKEGGQGLASFEDSVDASI